jgi:GH25 family lysozyme M1 (1,4-beta-N-acetylmuramidase)
MKIFLLGLLLVIPSLCVLGVDVSQLFSTATYTCIKNAGFSYVIPRGYCSYGGVDANIHSNLNNARAAGLSTDIYMFPCRGKSATSQVDQMVAAIAGNLYGTVWIDVETNPSSGCGWGSDHSLNCAFLTETINRIKSHGKTPGIYASKVMWTNIMGSASACTGPSSQLLWYAHYDNSASFSDFSPFGGWTKPHIKQYQGDVTLCGAGVDKNYRA